MAKKRRPGRKLRVDFRQNRERPGRRANWTRRYHEDGEQLADEQRGEQVRAKGDLSRRRTIRVDDDGIPIVEESQWRRGIVVAVHGLIQQVEDDRGLTWQCGTRRVLRSILIAQRSSVTVGDRVWFSDVPSDGDSERVGVIERVAERKTQLSRRDRRRREHTIVANADQVLIVASVAQPSLKPHLIDRYLVAAMKGGLDPLICFNKTDLLDDALPLVEAGPAADEVSADLEQEPAQLTVGDLIAEFRGLGYRCLLTSAVNNTGLDELRDALTDRMTVLSGQSGVGKSSLINALQPGLELTVAEVSRENEKGKHTTSLARLHRLDFGGYIVDTPGIRQFDMWAVEPGELEAGFVEFLPHLPKCGFSDCSHRHEQDCAVIAAVAAGRIGRRRYDSYLKMFAEV